MAEKEEDKTRLRIYTDGSCLGNPGPGGWAARLSFKETHKDLAGGFALTTNNRMELYAAIMALETLTRPCRVELLTDSKYLIGGVKGWLAAWKQKGWRNAKGKAVLNRDLWERLDSLLAGHEVHMQWVEGHSGHAENEDMDRLAKSWAERGGLPTDTGYRP
ncbi:MAG: ribonuclease HI [Desulfovibrio sp.]|jgi:ribonuclease HI|nr:ribonuclease HI [Desulfovibrio sp.]